MRQAQISAAAKAAARCRETPNPDSDTPKLANRGAVRSKALRIALKADQGVS
jgi:hypothetical protein